MIESSSSPASAPGAVTEGAVNTVKAACNPGRSGGRYVLVTICTRGGQGLAAIWRGMMLTCERVKIDAGATC